MNTIAKNRGNETLLTLSLFFLLFSVLLAWYSERVGMSVIRCYSYIITLFIMGAIFRDGIYHKRIEYTLAFCFVIWFSITRIINGDWFLERSRFSVFFLALSMCVALPYSMIIPDKRRSLLETLFSLIFIIFFLVLAWLSIYVVVTGQTLYLPKSTYTIMVDLENRLWIWQKHPNTTAGVFSICYFATLYLLAAQKKKRYLWIPVIIACVSFYIAIRLTDCRFIMISTSFFTGAIIASASSHHMFKIPHTFKVSIFILAWIIPSTIMYFGYHIIEDGINNYVANRIRIESSAINSLESSSAETIETQGKIMTVISDTNSIDVNANSYIGKEPAVIFDVNDDDVKDESVVANRPLINDFLTLNNRTTIYLATLKTLIAHPMTLLFGNDDQELMKWVNGYLNPPDNHYGHTHSSIFQVLMTCGIIGILIMFWFLFRLIKHSKYLLIKRHFSLTDVILVIIPLSIMAQSLLEPFIFTYNDIINLLFFYYAGSVMNRAINVQDLSPLHLTT